MFGGRRSRSAGRRTRRGGMNRIVVPGVLTGALLMHGPKSRRRRGRKSRRGGRRTRRN
tara:strand:- start:4945 stop:5118 length:174 start_codon:yes stop_codon:yes gene_type:complete